MLLRTEEGFKTFKTNIRHVYLINRDCGDARDFIEVIKKGLKYVSKEY